MNPAEIIVISGCTSAVIDILTTMAVTSARVYPAVASTLRQSLSHAPDSAASAIDWQADADNVAFSS
jgi:hypothetical protein